MEIVNTEWHEPHPRRLPTADETSENEKRILELYITIEETKAQIQHLEQLRKELEEELANSQSFIAPFRRLPTELLREIIWHSVEDWGRLPSDLNRICSAMRYAVNEYKELWTSIVIAPKGALGRIKCSNIQHFEAIVQRALPLPLTIEYRSNPLIPSMLHALVPYSQHVETLRIGQRDLWHPGIPPDSLPALDFARIKKLGLRMQDDQMASIALNIMNQVDASSPHPLFLAFELHTRAIPQVLGHTILVKATDIEVTILPESPFHLPEFGQAQWDQLAFGPYLQLNRLCLQATSALLHQFIMPNLTHLQVYGGKDRVDLCIHDIPLSIQRLELSYLNLVEGTGSQSTQSNFPHLLSFRLSGVIIADPDTRMLAPRLEDISLSGERYREEPWVRDELEGFCFDNTLFGSLSLHQVELRRLVITSDTLQHLSKQRDLVKMSLNWCKAENGALDLLISNAEDDKVLFPKLNALFAFFLHAHSYDEEFKRQCSEIRPSLCIDL